MKDLGAGFFNATVIKTMAEEKLLLIDKVSQDAKERWIKNHMAIPYFSFFGFKKFPSLAGAPKKQFCKFDSFGYSPEYECAFFPVKRKLENIRDLAIVANGFGQECITLTDTAVVCLFNVEIKFDKW